MKGFIRGGFFRVVVNNDLGCRICWTNALQLEEGNRNVDMKMFLEETFANYTKLIENSNVVAKKIKDNLGVILIKISCASSHFPFLFDPMCR